jgi:signal transduction histidine kinase/ligand-binding sensor domain-containing protein
MLPIRPRRLLVPALALLLTIFARAEVGCVSFARRVWETDDGLPHNTINSLIQRRDGFLWLATQDGLVRFDGLEFEKWRSPLLADAKAAGLRSVIEQDTKTLLVASDKSGLLQIKNGTLSTHPLLARFQEGQKIFWLFREDEGVFWILFADRQLWRCRGESVEVFPPPANLETYWPASFARTTRGEVYIARGSGVEKYERGQLKPFSNVPVQAATICASATGGLWIGTAGSLYRWKDGMTSVAAETAPWTGNWPPDVLLETRDESLWIGTRSRGLLRWKSGKTAELETSHPRINDLREDDEGNLWVATSGGGLNRFQRAKFTFYGEDAGLLTDISGGVSEDSLGNIWFANRHGIGRIHEGRLGLLSALAGWPQRAFSVCPDHVGNVWIGAMNQLFRVPAANPAVPVEVQIRDIGTIHVIFVGTDGSTWVAGETGPILRFRSEDYEAFDASRGFTGSHVCAVAEDTSGTIWAGTAAGQLFELTHGHFREYGRAHGLPDSPIRAMYGDKEGTLWIGTGGGGLIVRREGRFAAITENHGLPDDTVSQLLEDDLGMLWIGSSRALFSVRKTDLLDCAAGRLGRITPIRFGKADGLSGFSAAANYQPSAWKSSNGQLWFVSRKGLVMTQPDPQPVRRGGPRVYVESLTIDGQPADSRNVRITTAVRKLDFHFTAPTFAAPEKVLFRHRLEGIDREWTDADTQRVATYSTLPPGNYEFKVIASNSDLVWNMAGATMSFQVHPRWWETWWARATAISMSGAALVVLAWYGSRRRYQARLARLEGQRRLELERTRIARDLHDGLGASLTQAGMLAEELCEDCDDLAEMKQQSSQLATRVRTIARDLDAAVWAVSPKNDRLAALSSYLCQFALEYFRATPIRCLVEIAGDVPDIPLSPEVRHHLFLTAKEAMNNALKHSRAHQINVSMAVNAHEFELSIKDDGAGFCVAEAERSERNGLRNMRSRLAEIGGSLDIESSSSGTTVRMTLPVPASLHPNSSHLS